jgi:7,8-dihydroneopterin aldolase/epimerase/oxygenase
MHHKIKVNGIQLYAYHGCLEEESKIGGHYVVNVLITTDFTAAAEEDNLSKTVDYVQVNTIVKEEMAVRSKLIEQVALRIIKRLETEINHPAIYEVEIVKLSPPINGDVISVSVTMSSDDGIPY